MGFFSPHNSHEWDANMERGPLISLSSVQASILIIEGTQPLSIHLYTTFARISVCSDIRAVMKGMQKATDKSEFCTGKHSHHLKVFSRCPSVHRISTDFRMLMLADLMMPMLNQCVLSCAPCLNTCFFA